MYELTPALLNLYQDCARCFWVEMHENVKKPAGPYGEFHASIQLAFIKYTDQYRAKGTLPSELQGKVQGEFLPDEELMKRFRDSKRGLSYRDETLDMLLRGHLDECIVREEDGKRLYSPLKFKTRGFESVDENHDQHSQLQLDCFDFLLRKNGYETDSTGYLVYYIPEEVRESGEVMFNVQVIRHVTEAERAMNLISQAVAVLNGAMPKAGGDCEYCAWGDVGVRLMKGQD